MSRLNDSSRPFRLGVLASHPIQYQAPLFEKLAKIPDIELTVLFCSDHGAKPYLDKGFQKEIKWDTPLLNGYNYKILKNYSLRANPSSFWGLINFDIVKELQIGNYDAVWVHGWNSFTNWLVFILAYFKRVPILLRCETNLLPKTSKIKMFFKKMILSNLFKRISAFLAIGKYNTEFYLDLGVTKEKIFLVPYSVNNDYFMSKAKELIPQKKELREKYNIPVDLPVILLSGKLIDVKRPMDLLRAYQELSKEIQATLIFVGDGVLKDELENYVKKNQIKNVYFMGFKNQSELPKIYAIADVFVLPSSQEPWGLVVNEAMCFGLPVIVSDQVGACGDLIKEGINGFVYPSGDIDILSEKLKLFLNNSNFINTMNYASKEIICNWSYNEDIKGVLNCLMKLKKA